MHKRTALTASLIAMLSVAGVAQLVPSSQEQLDIPVGAIFEIQAATNTSTQFSWTLTQGQQFIEASRTHVFQTRFTQAGTYTLLGQLGDEAGNMTATRTFQINVQPRKPEDNSAALNPDTGVSDLVTFIPALSNAEVRLSADRQVLEVRHARADIAVIAIDLDTERDTNGDGNSANDDDTRDTLFRTNPNPLHLWVPTERSTTMKAGALLNDNTTKFQDFVIRFGDAPLPGTNEQPTAPEAPKNEGEIVVLKSDNGTVQLTVRIESAAESTPKLYQWKFGDGGQSLLDKPIHTYAEGGTYEVSVTVRDLKTGKSLSTVTDSIVVNRLREDVGTEPEPTEEKPNEENNTSSGSSGLLGMIVKILLGLVVSIGAGIGIVFAIGKLKKKNFSLEKVMENAEKNMVKTAPSASTLTMEMPMDEEPLPPTESTIPDIRQNIIDSEPIEVATQYATPSTANENTIEDEVPEENDSTHSSMEPSAAQLKADTSNAPDWLKAGIEKAQVVGQTPTAPPPTLLAADAPPEPLAIESSISDAETVPVMEPPATVTPALDEYIAPPAIPEPWQEALQAPQAPATPAPVEQPVVIAAPEPVPTAAVPMPTQITEKPAVQEPPMEKTPELVVTATPEPIPTTTPVSPTPVVVTDKPSSTTTPNQTMSPQDAEREEREREKKRLKRQRYRENKKKRETEEKTQTTEQPPITAEQETSVAPDDETVAIIRAENLGTEQTPPPPATPPQAKNEDASL